MGIVLQIMRFAARCLCSVLQEGLQGALNQQNQVLLTEACGNRRPSGCAGFRIRSAALTRSTDVTGEIITRQEIATRYSIDRVASALNLLPSLLLQLPQCKNIGSSNSCAHSQEKQDPRKLPIKACSSHTPFLSKIKISSIILITPRST